MQETLGVDYPFPFAACSADINPRFLANGDFRHPFVQYNVAALLERGLRTLIYNGATDFIVPWVRAIANAPARCRLLT